MLSSPLLVCFGEIMNKHLMIEPVSLAGSEIQKDCREWAREIAESFYPEIVIFVANSGYLYAKPIADALGAKLGYVKAVRSGDSAKNKLTPVMKLVPKAIINWIICSPLKFYYHSRKKDRNVIVPDSLKRISSEEIGKILIVDDSVDTGYTMKQVLERIKELFPGAVVKTASYVVSDFSKRNFEIDYCRFRNKMFLTATSRKSTEYEDYMKEISEWMRQNDKT